MVNINKETFSRDELKDALKKFKATRDDVQDEEVIFKSSEFYFFLLHAKLHFVTFIGCNS